MENILIADAGSTKTDWTLIKNKEGVIRFKSNGINPAHDSIETIKSNLLDLNNLFANNSIDKIYFFGAGCASDFLKNKVKQALIDNFKVNSDIIKVETDLTGAAIALFGDDKGIVCILGTGSSTALFSNGRLIERIPSLGYILGDEGSGVALGKRLLNAVFKKQISNELITQFQDEFHLSIDRLIENVYSKPKAAKFIASFSPFLLKNIHVPDIEQMVMDEFDLFFKKNILAYKDVKSLKIGMVGSIAYNYQAYIEKSAQKYGLTINSFIQKPMPSLENYFSK